MTEAQPDTIGRYEIRSELGRGMMGVVYEAFDPVLARTIALKTILLDLVPSPGERQGFEERFFTEARAAGRLSHPGIVTVHDVGRDPSTGALFLALEYLHGRTLADVIRQGRATEWREAFRLVGRVAEALHYAHTQGVIHRDVKPANIMMLPSGEPKIMDFGIAKVETARLQLTGSGQFFGTPLYMSPEQALGREVDGRSDLFSLGAIAYSLLTGRLAFGAETIPRIIRKVIAEDPPPPASVVPSLPPDVDYVAARALTKSPEDRYPDGRRMAEDLEDVVAGLPPRHRGGWLVPARAEGTLESVPALAGFGALSPGGEDATAVAGAGTGGEPQPRARRLDAGPGRRSRPTLPTLAIGAAVAALALAALVAVSSGPRRTGYISMRRVYPPATTEPAAVPGGQPAAAAPTPVAGSAVAPEVVPGPRPARLAVVFEHGLKSGRLRIWVDDALLLDEDLDSQVSRRALVFKKRKGGVEDTLDLDPGRHDVRVQVSWDDESRTERIPGSFKEGSTRRLLARLGGLFTKKLSLEWE